MRKVESRLSTMDEDFESVDAECREERHFRRLYDRVMDFYLKKMNNSERLMSDAISFIIDSFRWDSGRSFADIDFEREDMACGYIFRYGPHGAGLTRSRTLEALRNCPALRSILKSPLLSVASLGGGPGNDAVGFCSALSGYQFLGGLDIWVVDPARQWFDSVRMVAKHLKRGNFGDASELIQQGNVEFTFKPFSVPDKMENLPMGTFDVFLICKLISIISWEDKRSLVQKLYSLMKDSAFILLIDCPFTDDLWKEKFDILYLSEADQWYRSSATVERYGHNDDVGSRARIAVLRKKNIP